MPLSALDQLPILLCSRLESEVVLFLNAVLPRCSDEDLRTVEVARAVDVPRAPTFREHDGHAPHPCDASTRSATAICWARDAPDGLPWPP